MLHYRYLERERDIMNCLFRTYSVTNRKVWTVSIDDVKCQVGRVDKSTILLHQQEAKKVQLYPKEFLCQRQLTFASQLGMLL